MDKVIEFYIHLQTAGITKVVCRYSERNIDVQAHAAEGLHMHDCYEVYMNLEGNVSFVVEDKVYDISTGDVVLTRPNEFHYCLYRKSLLRKGYCLWIWIDRNAPLASILDRHIQSGDNLISADSHSLDRVIRLFGELQNENVESLELHRYATILQILDWITNSKSGAAKNRSPIPQYVQEIIDYINKNFPSIESLKEIYEKFGVSPNTLNRFFDKYLKTTPARYIENKRLSYAKGILLQGGSVMKAATDSGFADYSHFIKLFRLRFGVTPGKYYREKNFF